MLYDGMTYEGAVNAFLAAQEQKSVDEIEEEAEDMLMAFYRGLQPGEFES